MVRKKCLATALRISSARYELDRLFRSIDTDETPLYGECPATVSININGYEVPLPIFNDDGQSNDYNETMWVLLENFLECATDYYSQLAEFISDNNLE
jgi:hypothetical protein